MKKNSIWAIVIGLLTIAIGCGACYILHLYEIIPSPSYEFGIVIFIILGVVAGALVQFVLDDIDNRWDKLINDSKRIEGVLNTALEIAHRDNNEEAKNK